MAEKNVTVSGRLSFPVWTMDRAIALNASSTWPVEASRVAPSFNMFLEQDQLDKLVNHIKNTFLPWVKSIDPSGQKKGSLATKEVAKLVKVLDEGEWGEQPYPLFIKGMRDKDFEVAPEAVAFIKVKGSAGQDLVKKAVVRDDSDLVPGFDVDQFPAVVPIQQTVKEMYPGCVVGTTLNLYAFMSGKNPGIGAGCPAVVFKDDAEQIGGTALDEDELFLD